MPRPELLAPAGDEDCLRAAVANGADAVYFGLPAFNARRRATNFGLDELPRLMQYLHDRNVKGYVTLNTLVFSDELPEAARYVRAIAEAGADAVIVQDLGVARLIRRMVPSLPIHASTQTTQTEPDGIAMLHGLGIRRVIIARELSIEELQKVVEAAAVELEVFVHGALCISYSGQCLASASLWDRSANRGLCAQACRLPYKLLIDGRSLDLQDQRYLLSASDLCAADSVCRLARMGVAGFKIEGRLKDAAYVAAATRFYRKAIDAAASGEVFVASPADRAELEMAFSRGMGPGYLAGTNHKSLVHGRFPKKRGLFVGTVVGVTPRGVLVELVGESVGPAPTRQTPGFATGAANASSDRTTAMLLKPGDGVVFDAGSSPENEQGGRVYAVTARATGRRCVELTFGRGDVDFAAISVGSGVWKTDDPQLRRCLESRSRQDSPQHRCPVSLRVSLLLDGRVQATLVDESGREASAASDDPLEPARKHPLTVELLRDQFCRLGDTPFRLDRIEMNSSQGPAESLPVMAPKSVLNDLRRRVATQLKVLRDRDRRHDVIEPDALERIRREMADALRRPGDQLPTESVQVRTAQLAVLVRDHPQLDAALDWASRHASRRRLACVYGDFGRLADCDAAVRAAREAKQKLALAVPQVVMPGEQDLLERIAACRPDAVLVRSLASLQFLRRRFTEIERIGDGTLNVANEITARLFLDHGLSTITPAYELGWPELAPLVRHVWPDSLEVILYQHAPMFYTRYCLFAAHVSRTGDCRGCEQPCRRHAMLLRDRNDVDHPVLVDAAGRNTVFNASAQSAVDDLPSMLAAGLCRFRIELLHESAAETQRLLSLYADLLGGRDKPKDGPPGQAGF